MDLNVMKKGMTEALDTAGKAISPKYKADKTAEEKSKSDLAAGTKNALYNSTVAGDKAFNNAFAGRYNPATKKFISKPNEETRDSEFAKYKRFNNVMSRVKKATSKADVIPKWGK